MIKEYWTETLLNRQIRIDRNQFKYLVKRDAVKINITRRECFATARFLDMNGHEFASIDIFLP